MSNSLICDLLTTGALRGELVCDTLYLRNGTTHTFEHKATLKHFGCKWDTRKCAWRRDSPTANMTAAVSIARAQETIQAQKVSDARLKAIFSHVHAADATLRVSCWVGTPIANATTITPEARALAWKRHGMAVPMVDLV